jgi:hypothetical protein
LILNRMTAIVIPLSIPQHLPCDNSRLKRSLLSPL